MLVADDIFEGFNVSFFKGLHDFFANVDVIMIQDFLAFTNNYDVSFVLG